MVKKTICLDFGNTGIKLVHGNKEVKKVDYDLIDSEYLLLPNSSAEDLPQDAGMGKAVDSAWIRYSKKGECHLLGFTAKDYQAKLNLTQKKVDSIVPRTLGIIASIFEQKPFEDYRLGLLVPLNEIAAAKQLKADLLKRAKGFYYRDRKVSFPIDPKQIIVAPEGTGAAMRDATAMSRVLELEKKSEGMPLRRRIGIPSPAPKLDGLVW